MPSTHNSESTPTSNVQNIITNPDGVYESGFLFLCNSRTAADVIRLHMFALPKASPELEALQQLDNSKVVFFVFDLTTRLLSGFFHPVGGLEYDHRGEFFGPRYPYYWRYQLPYPCNQVWYLHESQMPEYLQQSDNRCMALNGPEVSELIKCMRDSRQYILITHILQYQRKHAIPPEVLEECRRQFTQAYGATPEAYYMRNQRNKGTNGYQSIEGSQGYQNHTSGHYDNFSRAGRRHEPVQVKSKRQRKWVNGIVVSVSVGAPNEGNVYKVLREDGIEWFYSGDSVRVRPMKYEEYKHQSLSNPGSHDDVARSHTPAPLVDDNGRSSVCSVQSMELSSKEESFSSNSRKRRASSSSGPSQDFKRQKNVTTQLHQHQLQPTLGAKAGTARRPAQRNRKEKLKPPTANSAFIPVKDLRIAVPEETVQTPQKRFEAPGEPDSENEDRALNASPAPLEEPAELMNLALDVGFITPQLTKSPTNDRTVTPVGIESRPLSRMSWSPSTIPSFSKTSSIWASPTSGVLGRYTPSTVSAEVSPVLRAGTPWDKQSDESKAKKESELFDLFGTSTEKNGFAKCRMPPKLVQTTETSDFQPLNLPLSRLQITPGGSSPRSDGSLGSKGQLPNLDWYEGKMLVSPGGSPRLREASDESGVLSSDGLTWSEADLDLTIPASAASALDNDSSWGKFGGSPIKPASGR